MNGNMRAIVLGAAGMLGRDLMRTAPAHVTVTGLGRADCDVTDPASVEAALDAHRPDVLLNAAAYTAVDRAESERDLALRANGEAPGVLGRACATRGIRVLHVGTDYVFPGEKPENDRGWREDDAVAPLNWYGHTKLAGEEALRGSGARHVIARTQWLYGRHGRSFPRTMWERARAGQPTRVVDDQHGAPTSTEALARALWAMADRGLEGTYHVACAGRTTWFEVARRVFARAGRPELVTPCATADYPTPARRPAWSVLDTAKLLAAGITLPPWEEELDRFLDGLEAESP